MRTTRGIIMLYSKIAPSMLIKANGSPVASVAMEASPPVARVCQGEEVLLGGIEPTLALRRELFGVDNTLWSMFVCLDLTLDGPTTGVSLKHGLDVNFV